MKNKNILIIAPHADDETFGMNGFIQRYVDDNNITVLCLGTSHNELSKKPKCEAFKKNTERFGYDVIMYDHDVLNYSSQTRNITNCISKYAKNNTWDMVFIPSGNDLHQDHKIVNHCAKVVFRPTRNYHLYELYEYQIQGSEHFSATYWNTEMQLSIDEMERKSSACSEYSTENIPVFDKFERFNLIYKRL